MCFRIVRGKTQSYFCFSHRKWFVNGYFFLPKIIGNWRIILGTNKLITIQEVSSHPVWFLFVENHIFIFISSSFPYCDASIINFLQTNKTFLAPRFYFFSSCSIDIRYIHYTTISSIYFLFSYNLINCTYFKNRCMNILFIIKHTQLFPSRHVLSFNPNISEGSQN